MAPPSKPSRVLNAAFALLLATATACAAPVRIPATTLPPPQRLDEAALFRMYLDTRPLDFKMQHQVEAVFAGKSEVMAGYLLVSRPTQFWVHALNPLGTTLFDVRSAANGDLKIDVRVPDLPDQDAPKRLAHDIARIYMWDCPEAAASDARPHPQGIQLSCEIEIPTGDDRLDTVISHGGAVMSKCYSRDGERTACITYTDYQERGDHWFAHRIELRYSEAPYQLTIALVDADTSFDASKVFEKE